MRKLKTMAAGFISRSRNRTAGYLFICLLSYQSVGCYSVRQAIYHNDLYNSRRPVSEVLADPETDEKTRTALGFVAKALDFATVHGLNAENAYTHYIKTSSPFVSYLVQAAYPHKFEFKTWWFPVVGRVPYLGFFSAKERDVQAEILIAEGFDVHKGGVGAFSSLGWFEDPIFSSMLRRSEADLVHLIFHELTHRTVWIPGSVEFNENLAEYIADRMTEEYLLASGKKDLIQIYFERKEDKAKFRIWLRELRAELSTFYDRNQTLNKASLIGGKTAIIGRYTKDKKPTFKQIDYVGDDRWNNASIMGASLYTPDLEMFEKAHACIGHGHLVKFLDVLKESAEKVGNGFKGLERLCK